MIKILKGTKKRKKQTKTPLKLQAPKTGGSPRSIYTTVRIHCRSLNCAQSPPPWFTNTSFCTALQAAAGQLSVCLHRFTGCKCQCVTHLRPWSPSQAQIIPANLVRLCYKWSRTRFSANWTSHSSSSHCGAITKVASVLFP